ncbi:MAG: hypothetical protein WCG36_09350, partial [bacterium]
MVSPGKSIKRGEQLPHTVRGVNEAVTQLWRIALENGGSAGSHSDEEFTNFGQHYRQVLLGALAFVGLIGWFD